MRLLASLPHYMAATDGEGLLLHQYATGSYAAGPAAVDVVTDYPWNGRVEITVTRSDAEQAAADWPLTLRIPHWTAGRWSASVAGAPLTGKEAAADDGWLRLRRKWRPGDTVVLELDLTPRLTAAPSRVDAVRGCAAIERGPLVHCVERVDQPEGTLLDDLRLDPSRPLTETRREDLLGGTVTVGATVRTAASSESWWPYGQVASDGGQGEAADPEAGDSFEVTAVPYHLWAHREDGPMRVWIPLDERDRQDKRR